jgi:hypothetical protein
MSDREGTGYKLEDFSIGDKVTLEHMFSEDEDGRCVLEENYERGLVGVITSIQLGFGRRYPISVILTHPDTEEVYGEDSFMPYELAPIKRTPDWEV